MFNMLVKQYPNTTSLVGYIHTLANVNPDIFLAQASDYPNKDKEHLDNKQLLAF